MLILTKGYGCAEVRSAWAKTRIEVNGPMRGQAALNCDRGGLDARNNHDSVTSIREAAFSNCKGLNTIEVPDSVTETGNSLFSGCSSLKSAKVSAGKFYISRNTFENCTVLKEVTIPKGVEKIGVRAFANCTGLSTIVFPSLLEEISEYGFTGCTRLKEITVTRGRITIESSAFKGCINLRTVNYPGNGDGYTIAGIFKLDEGGNEAHLNAEVKCPDSSDLSEKKTSSNESDKSKDQEKTSSDAPYTPRDPERLIKDTPSEYTSFFQSVDEKSYNLLEKIGGFLIIQIYFQDSIDEFRTLLIDQYKKCAIELVKSV